MKQGKIKLIHNFEGETGYIILRWFKTSAPLAAASGYVTGTGLGVQDGTTVTQVYYPAAHSQQSLLIEDLDPVVYLVKSYRSLDGITPTEELTTLACDAATRSEYSQTLYVYEVDRGESGTDPDWADPVSETIELRDERLLNATYTVEERGTGTLRPPSDSVPEYVDRSDDGGGFDFTVPGKVFEAERVYFVTVQNRVDITEDGGSGSGSGSGEVDGVVIIDDDTDFDPGTMNGKLLYALGPDADILVLAFPNLATLADCTFKVATHDGLQRYLRLQLDAGDTVRFRGEDRNLINLGMSEEMSFMIRENTLYVLSDGSGYRRLGELLFTRKQEINTVYCDGTLYQQTDEPRMMEFVETLAVVVTETQWASSITANGKTVYPYKGFFARDDVGGTIRVPDLRDMHIRALKYLDATVDSDRSTQGAGGFQVDAVGNFSGTWGVPKGWSYTGAPNNDTFGNGDPNHPQTRNLTTVFTTNFTNTRGLNIGLIPSICV